MMQGVIQNIYFSFFTLAGTVFVLAAVIIGIKLAFSALASEKAQYKANCSMNSCHCFAVRNAGIQSVL